VFLAKSHRLWLTPVVLDAADLKAIQAPVLVVAGDRNFASLESTAEIYRGLAKAQLFIVSGAGHGTFSGRAELVNLAIKQFLNSPGIRPGRFPHRRGVAGAVCADHQGNSAACGGALRCRRAPATGTAVPVHHPTRIGQ